MSIDTEDLPDQTAASLVGGILSDLQHLVEQQFQLTRWEIESELRQHASAAATFGGGIGILFLSASAFCLTLAHLLHWVTSPPGTDSAGLPLWACHALLAVVLAVTGGALTRAGRAKFESIKPSQNPAPEILQETLPWKTSPK